MSLKLQLASNIKRVYRNSPAATTLHNSGFDPTVNEVPHISRLMLPGEISSSNSF